jgi:hypothetical protein
MKKICRRAPADVVEDKQLCRSAAPQAHEKNVRQACAPASAVHAPFSGLMRYLIDLKTLSPSPPRSGTDIATSGMRKENKCEAAK